MCWWGEKKKLYCNMTVRKLGKMFSPVWKAKWAPRSGFFLLSFFLLLLLLELLTSGFEH